MNTKTLATPPAARKTGPNLSELQASIGKLLVRLVRSDLQWNDLRLSALLVPFCRLGATPLTAIRDWAQLPNAALAYEMKALVDAMTRICDLNFSEELEDIFTHVYASSGARSAPRDVKILWDRFSGSDEDGNALHVIGARFGITRERVRQIERDGIEAVQGKVCWTPAGDLALTALTERVPATLVAAQADPEVQARLGHAVSIRAFLRFRQMLGKSNNGVDAVYLGAPCKTHVVATTASIEAIRSTHRAAIAQICKTGAVCWSTLHEAVAEQLPGMPVTDDLILQMLTMCDGFEVLDLAGRYGWLGAERRSRLYNTIRKVVAVMPEGALISVDTLIAAIGREGRPERAVFIEGPTLPASVVLTICSRLPGVAVTRDRIGRDPGVALDALSEFEQQVADFMRGRGGVASRAALQKQLVDAHELASSSITPVLQYSPILTRVLPGVYQLVGWDAQYSDLERAVDETGPHGSLSERGAATADEFSEGDDTVRFTYKVGDSAFSMKRIHVPATLNEWFKTCPYRRFTSSQLPGLVLGTGVEVSGSVRLRKVNALFEHLGIRVGDDVKITVTRAGTVFAEKV